ncbi:MAG TPA: hypothetical protein VLA76_01900 [Candidatus Angelobacter sp.]|nr:hypothetical protein [Candidatus Angelobacter sp.]
MMHVHEHKFRPQPAGGLTLRQFVESLRRWTPEMRHLVQIALTRTETERRTYLQQFHAGHHDRPPGPMDSFIRWAYSDPRIDDIPLLLAEIERSDADYAGALEHEADVLVRERAHGKSPARRVADYLALLGMENNERVRAAVASLLPPETSDDAVAATIRHMRRRWLELYGDDPFFAED